MSKKNQKENFRNHANVEDFQWPEFNSDSKRIKAYSNRYKDKSIAEALADAYNIKLSKKYLTSSGYSGASVSENTPKELKIGDYIKTRISNITKNHVDFDTLSVKENLYSAVNLYKYDRFKKFIPSHEITAKVVNIKKDRVYIDPIAPFVETWLKEKTTNPKLQYTIGDCLDTVEVKNLKLTRGGFLGDAVIPTVKEFTGEEFTIPAFIPGSQIVLNIAEDFNEFEGKSVRAFVLNYTQRPNSDSMMLICSVKELLKHMGNRVMIEMFNSWCEDDESWKKIESWTLDGVVTGVINSSKKCGVFIEIPEFNITGMVNVKADELVNYKPHQNIQVKLKGFDEEMYFNQNAQQMQHVAPYTITNGVLEKCNLKPIFELA